MQSFPEITSSSILTPYFWESLFTYIEQSLPPVKWSLILSLEFWQKTQNMLNLYFYLGLGAIPTSFVVGFFSTAEDEKRVDKALKAIFTVAFLIVPISIISIFIVINGYQAIIKGLRSI